MARASATWMRAVASAMVTVGSCVTLTLAAAASADPEDPSAAGTSAVGPVQVMAPTADSADPAAVSACGRFALVLDGTALYYENFAEALETYRQPGDAEVVRSSSTLSRTALRQGAADALSASNIPGLAPQIAAPMRSWSLKATKLLIKMGLRGTGETLDTTAAEMNSEAYAVQQACAAAGTHA